MAQFSVGVNNPTSTTTNGVTKTMSYDYKGRVLTESVNGATNIYTYDVNGNMLTASMATGYQLTMVYDSAGRLLSIADNMGGSSSFGIDDYTNEVLSTSVAQNNALVRARNQVLDSLGRTVQTWNATARTKRTTSYGSKATLPDSTTDANGNSSSYGWSSKGMTSYSSGSDSSTDGYDNDGNLTSVVANGQTTTMAYDEFGRITSINSPDSGSKSFSYSATQDAYTDSKGIVHTLTKGTGGLPQMAIHQNNDLNIYNYESYAYDGYGRLNKITTGNSETDYTRNSQGLVDSKTLTPFVSGFKSYAVGYGYDSAGQLVTQTYPSGMVVNYSYTNGFLTGISAGGTPVVSNVAYNSMLKEPVSWSLGGNQVSMSKDADGLLTGFADSGLLNQSIGTDNEGHVTSASDSLSSNTFSVSLNQNYGLVAGTINGKTLSYQYGSNQNVSLQQDGLTNYEFEMKYGTNKIDSLWLGGTDTSFDFQYDGNGNLRVDHKATYQYDGENRLEYFTDKNGNMTRYYYDGLGQRIAKWIQGGQLSYFVYNENKQLIGEYDSSGNTIAEYVYFGARPVAVKNGSGIGIVHTDYLGTPRVVTSGGSVVWQWKNDNPYGNNQATGSMVFNLRFTGQYYDSESGLHYNINRTYDPETGRYLQSDPMGLSAGFNTYNYVNKNPLDGVDPLGLLTKVLVDVSSLGISHVAFSVNGMTYGLMPTHTGVLEAVANNPVLGILDKYPESEFIAHYAQGQLHEKDTGFFDDIYSYEIKLTSAQEQALTQYLEGLAFYQGYQPLPRRFNNCASFVTNTLKKFAGNIFERNIFPWQVKDQMEGLADRGLVIRDGIYYAHDNKY